MNKNDLGTGLIVETRDKELMMLIADVFIGDNRVVSLYSYQDDLKSKVNEDLDIMKIYKVEKGDISKEKLFDKDNLIILKQRDSGEETLEQLTRAINNFEENCQKRIWCDDKHCAKCEARYLLEHFDIIKK